MGGVLDDCRLRFVKMWRRPPQNTPDFGVQRIFLNNERATVRSPFEQRAELQPEQRTRTLIRASLNYGARPRPSGGCEHLLAELGWCWRLKAHDEEESTSQGWPRS